jgi:hypothetical protein
LWQNAGLRLDDGHRGAQLGMSIGVES